MISRDRRATFPGPSEQGGDKHNCLADLSKAQDPRCFRVPVQDGQDFLVDLRQWENAAFTLSVAPALHEYIRQMGPAPIRRTLYCKLVDLRRFWRFLDEAEAEIGSLEDITAGLVNRYEDWLIQTTPSSNSVRRVIGPLIHVLRIAIQLHKGRYTMDLEHRLGWVSRIKSVKSRPRDAYSKREAAALRAAARQQIRLAQDRVLPDGVMPEPRPDIQTRPRLLGFYNDLLAAVDQEGAMLVRSRQFRLLKCGLQNNQLPNLSSEMLHGSLYLTANDIVAFFILLSLKTGMEIECLRSLTVDCLQNPSKGYVEIEYFKRRSRNSEWKHLRVRDGGSSTPGGIIRLAVELTKRARRYLSTDALWVFWDGQRLQSGKPSRGATKAFVARNGLIDDDGDSLKLELSRLRKTHKAERYLRTHGQLDDFASGHSVPVAANHYAEIPALRQVHEQTIAKALHDAFEDALKPTLIDPNVEMAEANSTGASDPTKVRSIDPDVENGDFDIWLAHCGGFYSSPYGPNGAACPSPFWGCLECKNAVITVRKLPALIAFQNFMINQRAALEEEEWFKRFGRAYYRITAQVLPAFPEESIREARKLALTTNEGLIYLPAEAR